MPWIFFYKESHVSIVCHSRLRRANLGFQKILGAVGGSKSVTARILGLDRTTLWRKLERYQIEGGKPGKS